MEIALLGTSVSFENPPFIHLLLTADIVEFNDEIRLLRLKIRGRIVNAGVRLSDSGKSNVHGFRLEFTPYLSDAALRVTVAIQEVVSGNPGFMNQAFEKILPKTCGVSDRRPTYSSR